VWHRVRIQSRAFHDPAQLLVPETVNASPSSPTWEFGRRDGVIVNTDPQHTWPRSGLEGHTVGHLRMIMRAPGINKFLAYVQRFDIVNPAGSVGGPRPDSDMGMYRVRRAWRTNGIVMGDIIPLDQLRAHVELTPQFGLGLVEYESLRNRAGSVLRLVEVLHYEALCSDPSTTECCVAGPPLQKHYRVLQSTTEHYVIRPATTGTTALRQNPGFADAGRLKPGPSPGFQAEPGPEHH
ncbi:hypothetical protein DFH09DRAFT_1500056, partial [Mycena vulgaris]